MTIYGLILLGLTVQPASGSADNGGLSSSEAIGKVAVLTFGNLTETDSRYQFIVDQVQLALQAMNIDFVAADDLRPVLRKHRIRSRGRISQFDASVLRDDLGVDLILIGSIDLIRETDMPELSLSLRLVSPDSVTIRSAVSVSASGRDYTGLFEVGTVEDIDRLIELVAADAVQKLLKGLQEPAKTSFRPDRRWAVVPFDNSSKNRSAGQIMANWVISYLVTEGYKVVEPGTIDRLFQPNGGSTIGGIDSKRANLTYDSLGVSYVITGEVDIFNQASGILENSTPELTFGARVSDSQSGMVVTSYESETTGDQFETILGIGRYHSIGRLAPRIFEDMRKSFEKGMVNYGANNR